MAHNAIPLSSIQLVDRWPGPVNPGIGKPIGGWDGSHSCFSTTASNRTPPCPIGQKRMAYTDNTHCPGWYTMMYLQYHAFEDGCVSADFSDTEMLCIHSDHTEAAAEWFDNSHTPYFVVTNEITLGTSDYSRGCRLAIPCSTMGSDATSGYDNSYGDNYGWFWVGGVCPALDATILDTTAASPTGLGVDVACSSTYEGGPLALDTSGDRLFFMEHIYGPVTPQIYGIQQNPIVAYGDVSGS